ncbi:restriction endonuclease [Pontibacter sp. MBLB2868]|uniref:restriction endonuclease n=1 Tax=Pontibacter sp. MBLB2868 TaxID=3451555 RepID=UPI003F74CFB8
MDQLVVTKASGEKVLFSVDKLMLSLRKSGADEAMVQEVLRQLEPSMYEGITTKKIYKHAFAILKRLSKATAARYSLKQGIMKLGPSGFPFEKFVAELLKAQGYATQIGVFVDGHCVRHEIDVIASKDGQHFMIECKYHNLNSNRSNVRIPMYIHSRFKDVEKEESSEKGNETRFHQGWVVTNTRFTEDAIRYARCMNLHLVGWDFPSKGSIKDMVNSYDLYPLTCLTTLSQVEKQKLLDTGVVLCKELQNNATLLHKSGVKEKHLQSVLNEVDSLCSIRHQ